MKKLVSLFSLVILFTSCSQTPNVEEIKLAISASNETFMKGISSKALDSVSGLYTDDCILMAPGMAALDGKEGVKGYMEHAVSSGVSAIKLTTLEVAGGIDFAIERGQYEVYVADTLKVDYGKYMVQWKKTANGWLMHRDIMNSDLPPAPPAAAVN